MTNTLYLAVLTLAVLGWARWLWLVRRSLRWDRRRLAIVIARRYRRWEDLWWAYSRDQLAWRAVELAEERVGREVVGWSRRVPAVEARELHLVGSDS